MSVVIRVNTGFVGAEHIEETGLSVEEWNDLSDEGKREYLQGAIDDTISSDAIDEDTDEVID